MPTSGALDLVAKAGQGKGSFSGFMEGYILNGRFPSIKVLYVFIRSAYAASGWICGDAQRLEFCGSKFFARLLDP